MGLGDINQGGGISEPQSEIKTKKGVNLKKGISAFCCSLVLSIGLSTLLVCIYSPFASWGFFIGILGFGYWLYKSESIKKLLGRSFIVLSVESFALPIVLFIWSSIYVSTETTGVAEALGASIGGGIITLISGFLGFFLGIIFLIIGYFLLKR